MVTAVNHPTLLACLSPFQCNDNQLATWDDLRQLERLTALETIYLEHNPLWDDADNPGIADPNYRRKVKLYLPQVRQIDATLTR